MDRAIDDSTFRVQHYGRPVLRPEDVCKALFWGLTTPAIYCNQTGLCLGFFHTKRTCN